MKKLLVLLLVLGITSLASATTVSLTAEGTTINATPGSTVTLLISSDAATALVALDAIITVTGGDVITGAVNVTDCVGYGWDSSLSFNPSGLGTAAPEIGLGNFMGNSATSVGYVDVAYTGGTQIVSIAGGSAFGGSGDAMLGAVTFSSGVVTIVPEPMTIALLGLGGLFLLRRRK
jgi:hypothetical protein